MTAAQKAEVKFSKYHGIGNDFILIDNRKRTELAVTPNQATRLCDRNFGIGADGIIFATPANGNAHFSMRILNNDGSEPEMCGNGIRCLAKFISEIDHSSVQKFKINTLAGLIQPELLADGQVRVDMGEPVLEADKIPTSLPSDAGTGHVIRRELVVEGDTYTVTAVSMGNPHACVFSKNGGSIKTADINLFHIGPLFERNSAFPSRINTEFVEVIDRTQVRMVVWERGAGPTLACGTGACALVVAGVLENRIERCCDVELPGGHLQIEWDTQDNHVYMTGPAECVFTGTAMLPSVD